MGPLGTDDPTLLDLALTMAVLNLTTQFVSGVLTAAVGFFAAFILARRRRQ